MGFIKRLLGSPEPGDHKDDRIVQIIPADKWYALRENDEPDKLVCFALMSSGHIEGLIVKGDGTVIAVCKHDTFQGYVYQGDSKHLRGVWENNLRKRAAEEGLSYEDILLKERVKTSH